MLRGKTYEITRRIWDWVRLYQLHFCYVNINYNDEIDFERSEFDGIIKKIPFITYFIMWLFLTERPQACLINHSSHVICKTSMKLSMNWNINTMSDILTTVALSYHHNVLGVIHAQERLRRGSGVLTERELTSWGRAMSDQDSLFFPYSKIHQCFTLLFPTRMVNSSDRH